MDKRSYGTIKKCLTHAFRSAWALLLLGASFELHAQVTLPDLPEQQDLQAPVPQPQPSLQPQMLTLSQGGMGMNQPLLSEILGEADLAPHESIERLPPLWPYYLGAAVLALILLLVLVILILRRRRKEKPVPIIPVDVLALDALGKLHPLVEQSKAREFSYKASEIIRSYIEDRFAVRARSKTTREFLENALTSENTIPEGHHENLREFLNYCDLAKYARHVMQPEQLKSMLSTASDFIKNTRPSIMAAPGEEGES